VSRNDNERESAWVSSVRGKKGDKKLRRWTALPMNEPTDRGRTAGAASARSPSVYVNGVPRKGADTAR
jgi:hypothetical protein